MQQIEQSIASAFVNDRLAIHLCGGIQGPHTLTFGVKLYQGTKANIAKAMSLGPAIEGYSGISPVRMYRENGLILVELPSPEPVIIDGTRYTGDGLAVPVGLTGRRAIIGVDFDSDPHLALVGPTKRGKTVAQRGIAFHLARQNRPSQVRFIFSTFKDWEWEAYGKLPHTMAVINEPSETETMIHWLVSTMRERLHQRIQLPHLFLFLDDLLNLLGEIDVATEIGQLASLGRGVGIHLVIGTQRLNEAGSGGAIIHGNMPVRLVFGTASAQDASIFTGRGESGAELLGKYKGDALLVDNGSKNRLAVALITDDDLLKFPQSGGPVRPWQHFLQKENADRTSSMAERVVDVVLSTKIPLLTEPVLSGSKPVENGSKPLLSGPARTTLDREMVMKIYHRTGSKNQVYKLVWGYKNGDTQKWLNEILQEDEQ